MKSSIGIDIVYFIRIEKIFYKYGLRFARRILSKYEIKHLPKKKYIITYIAKCFASKEALSKALGSGFRKNMRLPDISLYKNHLGKPNFYISGKTKNFCFIKNIKNFDLTITDENQYILCIVSIKYNINVIDKNY